MKKLSHIDYQNDTDQILADVREQRLLETMTLAEYEIYNRTCQICGDQIDDCGICDFLEARSSERS